MRSSNCSSEEVANKQWVFNCGRWLDKGEDDGQIIRELVPVANGVASSSKVVRYRVSVRTGDRRGAGTDANVFIILHGEKGANSGKRFHYIPISVLYFFFVLGHSQFFAQVSAHWRALETILREPELTHLELRYLISETFPRSQSDTMEVDSEVGGFWIM